MLWVVWAVLLAIFLGSYFAFFGYMRSRCREPWNLKLDESFRPLVSVLVPVHNEEKVIRQKLENLRRVSYPQEKMEVVVIDDASTDGTLEVINGFVKDNPDFRLRVVAQEPRSGKAGALNKGLSVVSSEVVVVTDADAFWSSDILVRALAYLSDPSIGALSGRQVPISCEGSWVARGEAGYLDLISVLRLGESKVHSTIRFEGVFCAFKRSCFREFDSESGADDSGTALQVVQNGFRAILIPEVSVPSEVPSRLGERVKVKTRRATHLAGLWITCLKLLFRRKLLLPKKIALPEIFISLFDPFVFLSLVIVTVALLLFYPLFLLVLVVMLGVLVAVPLTRVYFAHGFLDQFVLLYSIFLYAGHRRFTSWEKV